MPLNHKTFYWLKTLDYFCPHLETKLFFAVAVIFSCNTGNSRFLHFHHSVDAESLTLISSGGHAQFQLPFLVHQFLDDDSDSSSPEFSDSCETMPKITQLFALLAPGPARHLQRDIRPSFWIAFYSITLSQFASLRSTPHPGGGPRSIKSYSQHRPFYGDGAFIA